jgi:hypothetical protein
MQETHGDTRFVPKVWPTTKVAYVSVLVIKNSWVSFNPNPPKLPPGQPVAHYQSQQRGGQYKLPETQPQSLGALERHLVI